MAVWAMLRKQLSFRRSGTIYEKPSSQTYGDLTIAIIKCQRQLTGIDEDINRY